MGVNSITALKLSAIVPRILSKKEAFISGRFLRLSSSSLFIFNEHLIYDIFFSPILFKVNGWKLLKCSLKTAWDQVKVQFIKSDFQRVRGFFFFFLFSVRSLNLSILSKNSSGAGRAMWSMSDGVMDVRCHTNYSVGCIKERIKVPVRK